VPTPPDWSKASDDELAQEAQAGLRGQGAPVEMSRRLRDAILDLKAAILNEERVIKRLTVVLVVLTVLQLLIVGFQVYREVRASAHEITRPIGAPAR